MRASARVRVLAVLLAGCGFSPHASTDAGRAPDSSPPTIDAPITALDAIPANWWNPAWGARSTITIDRSLATTPLTSFPVLVTLTPQTFDYGRATGNGSDLRFIAADGTTELPHDVDDWNPAGSSAIWVGVDLPSSGSDPVITMYYDNPTATATDNPAALFAMDVSVHHLSAFHDVTGHGHEGSATDSGSDTTPTKMPGRIGGAQAFDGSTSALALANSATPAYDFGSAMSLSVWINAPAFGSGSDDSFECFVCKGDNAWRVQREDLTEEVDFGTTSGGTNDNFSIAGSVIDDARWHHLGFVKDGVDEAVYIDGVIQTPTQNNAGPIDTTTKAVVLGENLEATATRHFHGMLDELRITANSLPTAWMQAEYATVTTSTFAVIGAIETIR